MFGSQYPPPTSPSPISVFFSKLFFRIRVLVLLGIIWCCLYAANILSGNRIAVEYDGGIAETSSSIQTVETEKYTIFSKEYWQRLNSMAGKDKTKPMPAIICLVAKSIGIRPYILASREDEGADALRKNWKKYSHAIIFVPEPNDIYDFLEKEKPLMLMASSDEAIVQAVKAAVKPVRIKRKSRNHLPGEYNPGKYGEAILPFSGI